jgi:hypothetical protein
MEGDKVGMSLVTHPYPVTLLLLAQAIFEPSLSFPVNTPTFLKHSHSAPFRLRRWNRRYSEMSAYKIQTLENYPEQSIQHSEHGESLKSRKF